ncbi:ribosome biogenesis/translation initiation ATPase RLI [Candidatus Woesearchaeota archaeon]|nr:ribosome biogenesis/translation initiation ATPase RLI [Candidatus Woesearchaeota archaeon]
MTKRIAVVDNEKLRDMEKKKHIQSLCPVNRAGTECMYFQGTDFFIDEGTCIGCGICVKRAPNAIWVINLPEALDKPPVHRYGQNKFALYNLPIPLFGRVTGIVGRNGIGKTTALKILAGMLQPNLGKEEASYDDMISFFKGTEAQKFFERLKNKEITVSYKPQQVDLIPKQASGSVKELLQKVDEQGKFDEIVKELELERILDNDVSKISGGELQRVAIAATVLKKANIYFFDEPTSFLDIKQRIKVSKFIRKLADDKTAVMVVEHDLIILDYMTDDVHIMYGKEGVYGICSGIKSTRNGINVYLAGYLKEENMRFRDKPIKFTERAEERKATGDLQVGWQGITKKLGKFDLEATQGEIHKDDVIGVLGENGIGKTSFVRILAGVDKSDSGEVDTHVTVSYKPQYLESGSDELVSTLLSDAISKYSNQIIKPLNIEPLFERKINELSGGELQRVAIALCLSKDAQLYVMDEPSAYLDVEQRLTISKVIRDLMEDKGASSLVVDHDLIFLDNLSEKLMVFDGEPALRGKAKGPFTMEEGMTMFLTDLDITFRRDEESLRPRVNKSGSVKDREQKDKGKYYYR